MVLSAAFAPVLTPHDPTFLDPAVRLQGPSREHPLGTDDRGRDIFSRVIYGGRVSLMIGVSVTLAAALIGSALGLMSGYFPRLDTPIMRTLDGLMAFPSILLAIAIMASLGTVGGQCLHRPGRRLHPDDCSPGALDNAGDEAAAVRGVGALDRDDG